jgi:DNA-binding transcriptional LysR family regulator
MSGVRPRTPARRAKYRCEKRNSPEAQSGGDVDQLDAMRVFLAVAKEGSFSSGARVLGIPVATVSRKLGALETHLGARLLARTTRKMALTEAGRRYLDACQRIVADVEDADRSLSGEGRELSGALAVTAPVAFGRLHVLPVIAEFLRAHPRVDVRFALTDRMVPMIDEGIDVAIRIAALPDSSLIAARVGAIRRMTCASPNYLRERGTPARPEALASHDCITFNVLASAERWSFPTSRGLRSVTVRSRLTVTTAEAAIDAAVKGLGITRVFSYHAAPAIAAGRLVPILERFEPAAVPVCVLHGEGRSPRPKVREFVGLARTRLQAALRERAAAR